VKAMKGMSHMCRPTNRNAIRPSAFDVLDTGNIIRHLHDNSVEPYANVPI